MRRFLALAALGITLGQAARASAAEPKRNAISYEPFALLSRGMVLQYERLVWPRISVVGGAGARFGARDDFSSQTWLGKAEARWWAKEGWGMTGPYFALGTVAARTAVQNRRQDRSLGAYWQIEETLSFGYRFVVFGFQEITPSWGLSMIHEFDERGILAPVTRGTLGMNLSVGWMF